MEDEQCSECGSYIDDDELRVYADICNECCRCNYPDEYDEFMSSH